MVSKIGQNDQGKRRGAVAVEFAIIAPFMVFLLVGMIEVTRGIMVKQVLSDGARSACRSGALPGSSNSSLTTQINDILTDNSLNPSDATITFQVNDKTADVNSALQYDKISVKISVPASKISWLTPLFLAGRTLESETFAMMRQR